MRGRVVAVIPPTALLTRPDLILEPEEVAEASQALEDSEEACPWKVRNRPCYPCTI